MGIIVDISIVAIIAFTVYMAIKRGFTKTVLGVLGFFLAVIIALIFCSTLASALKDGGFGTSVSIAVDRTVDDIVTGDNYETVFDNDEDGEKLLQFCRTFGAEDLYEDIEQEYSLWVVHGLESTRDFIKDTVREPAVDLCCNILAFLLLFIVARILLKVAEIIIGKVVKLPVLKQADKLLGIVAGVLLAVVRVYMFCLVLRWILPVAGSIGWQWAMDADLSKSALFVFFENINFLSILI